MLLPLQREHAGVTHAVPEQGCTCIHRAGSLRNLGARTTVTRVDETLLACRRWVGRVWVGEEVIGLFSIPLVFLVDVLLLRILCRILRVLSRSRNLQFSLLNTSNVVSTC